MSAFCGLKMTTHTDQSTRLSSLAEQVLHSSLIPQFFIIPAKKFISSLWYKGFDWHEALPDELQQQYNQIAKEIEAASAFVSSRYLDFDKTLPIEMHVFCDA